MTPAAPRSVIVVGRDAALWLTAASLADAFGPTGLEVIAVELPTACGPASLFATLPPLEALHAKLGLDEAAMLAATGGSFTLGWNVAGASGRPFFLAHGGYGAPIDGAPFFGFWSKARHYGLDAAFEDFSPTAMAARHGRMLVADEEVLAFGRADYGYHLPALPYLALLKRVAARRGVVFHRSVGVSVDRAGDRICSIVLTDGTVLAGDLFVDASGEERALLGGAAPNDGRSDGPALAMIEAVAPGLARPPSYGELRCVEHGLLAIHAARGATHVRFAFERAALDDRAALTAARAATGLPLDAPIVRDLIPAIATDPWRGNCIAIGASARAFAPVFAPELHAVQLGIVHLLALFPSAGGERAAKVEYNRIICSLFDRVVDFQDAFVRLARHGGTFWQQVNAVPPSPALAHRLATFAARGTIAPMEDDSFADDLWIALLIGLGLVPESWPPAVDRIDTDRLKAAFKQMLGFVKRVVLAQPAHGDYLAELVGQRAA